MKRTLFATSALAAMAIGGAASAQGIALFGDARLGLGYNINNDGGVLLETDEDGNVDTTDDLRGVSRVRFGVNMTGETDSGITFGATIRADNAIGGQGGTLGQTAGNVFVSGDWGTLTMGDTNGADEQWVGDVNEVGLTCLGCQNETLFVSNGGGFGSDTANNFASNPEARPTIRYDFDIMGFGLSLSSNRDLTDIGVGGGYAGQWGNASWNIGAGYYQFDEFSVFDPEIVQVQVVDDAGDPVIDANGDPVLVNVAGNDVETEIGAGEQWSVGAGGDFDAFSGKVVWTQISADDTDAEAQELLIGLGFGFDAWSVDGYYGQIISASGGGSLDTIDGLQSYGVGVTYDLGGGARVEGGVASVWDLGLADDGFMVADFGIGMAF